jgi:Na+-transporting NADH:ubiquinone oxidoreductase subunit NqrF
MNWKGRLAIAIGIFTVIAVVVVFVIPVTSNRLPSRSDVRVGVVHEEQTGGVLLHYAV